MLRLIVSTFIILNNHGFQMVQGIAEIGGNNGVVSFESVFKQIEGLVVDLDQAGNEIKFSNNPLLGIKLLIEENSRRIKSGVTKLRNELKNDQYLNNILLNWPRFSDPIKPMWFKVAETSNQANDFFVRVNDILEKTLKTYIRSVEAEVDPITSPFNENFLATIKSKAIELLETKLESQSQQLTITEFQTQCQALVEEITNYEINKQVENAKRKRRSAANKGSSTACTKDINFTVSHRSQIVSWSEEFSSAKIPSTVSFTLLSCYEVQITEGILEYILYAYEHADASKVQKLQEKQTNLDLTTMWTFNKFQNSKQLFDLHKSSTNEQTVLVESPNGLIELEEIWMCTPETISIGENVLRFSGVMQTCIVEETELHRFRTCSGKCHHYYGPVKHQHNGLGPVRQSGPGVKCKRLAKGKATICPSTLKDQLYEWFDVENSTTLPSCNSKPTTLTESWRMEMGSPIMKTPELCEICQCDSCSNYHEMALNRHGKKYYTNFFRIGEIVSDIEKGMVVTGVKFEVKHGLVFVSIEQGKLLPNNQIDSSTLSWIQPELSSNYSNDPSIVRLKTDFSKMNLDSLDMLHNIKKGNYILTGIRFNHHQDHLSLEAQLTQFDIAKGQPKSSLWINGLHDHRERKLISVADGTDTNNYGMVEFQTAQDGQVIVPYFDGQAVQVPGTTNRLPIGGIELFHKNVEKNGNFGVLGLRLLGIKGVVE